MSIIELLKSKQDFRHLDGVSTDEIDKAENELGLKFADDYREYLCQFALGAYDSHEFTGICKSPRLSVVSATKREKLENDNISDDMYLIEYVGMENYSIWQNTEGNVFGVPYMDVPKKIYDSLTEYIESHG